MASTLRTAIRTIADASATGKAIKAPDPETVKRTVAALEVIWKALKGAWPRFRAWFQKGLSDDDWARFQELANRLPAVTAEERQELLMLVRRGLRLEKQSPEQTENELSDDELDAPMQPA